MFELSADEVASAPKIILGDRQWPVPVLAARQLRVILPLWRKVVTIDYAKVTTSDLDTTFDVLHAALTRAHPAMTRDEILDMPIALHEISPALDVIAGQMRILKKPGDREATGETKGETGSPTSTTSSPTS